jgi:hypothetical protein
MQKPLLCLVILAVVSRLNRANVQIVFKTRALILRKLADEVPRALLHEGRKPLFPRFLSTPLHLGSQGLPFPQGIGLVEGSPHKGRQDCIDPYTNPYTFPQYAIPV